MKSLFFLPFIFLFLSANLFGQRVQGISSVWDNDLKEWTVYLDDEEGFLKVRWLNNPFEWEYDLPGGVSGTIRRKWRDDPSQWEIRGNNGELITARTIWPNDFTEWRITNNSQTVTLETLWSNNVNVWQLRKSRFGKFTMRTAYENDIRDWQIDEMTFELSIHMRMTVVFLSLFNSFPPF